MVNFLIASGMFVVGAVLSAFGFMQILISLRVSRPLILSLDMCRAINKSRAIQKMMKTIIFWFIVCGGAIAEVIIFGNFDVKLGFFVGFGVAFLIGFRRTGMQIENNGIDFFRAFRSTITDIKLRQEIEQKN